MPQYVGRFAPSPSGPLHFGSLVAALASYLDARAHCGLWLLRIDDLDPPREASGASAKIISALRDHGLQWDGEICWQRHRHEAYALALQSLQNQQQVYFCDCTRAMLAAGHGRYPGRCRKRGLSGNTPSACRVWLDDRKIRFDDLFQGPQSCCPLQESGDFVVRRKDGLFAYQLAVVVDDAASNITHIIRGADLLDSCSRQIYLQQLLGLDTPSYGHVPVASNIDGQKLSKQNLAQEINRHDAMDNLLAALRFLGQALPPEPLPTPSALLRWTAKHWRRDRVPRCKSLVYCESR